MTTRDLRALALTGRPLDEVFIVDFHVHLERWGRVPYPVSEDGLIAKMDRVGVNVACVNGILHIVTSDGNRAVASFARKHPGRVVGIAGTDEAGSCPKL